MTVPVTTTCDVPVWPPLFPPSQQSGQRGVEKRKGGGGPPHPNRWLTCGGGASISDPLRWSPSRTTHSPGTALRAQKSFLSPDKQLQTNRFPFVLRLVYNVKKKWPGQGKFLICTLNVIFFWKRYKKIHLNWRKFGRRGARSVASLSTPPTAASWRGRGATVRPPPSRSVWNGRPVVGARCVCAQFQTSLNNGEHSVTWSRKVVHVRLKCK